MKAIWNNKVIAESDDTVVIEGNHYFPPGSIKKEFFKENNNHTSCPSKGQASYYDLEVEGKTKSQRLRGVLYVLWGNGCTKDDDFNTFYANEMNKIIEHYKNKLD